MSNRFFGFLSKQKIGIACMAMLMSACDLVPQDVSVTSLSNSSRGGSSAGGSNPNFNGITAATTMSSSKVKLQWNASQDPTVVAYNIYDSANFFSPRLIRTVMVPSTSVTITGLAPVTLNSFRVKAANSSNNEDSNKVDAQAIPYGGISSVTVTSSTTATVYFEDAGNADSVTVFCKTAANPEFTALFNSSATVGLTNAKLTGLSPGVTYTCKAATTISGFTDNNTKTIDFIPIGQATKLVFVTQPGSTNAGAPLAPQPVVQILDANDNLVSAGPDSTALITLSLASTSPTAGTVRGSASISAVGGIAMFTGINFQEAGLKIVTATKADTSNQTFGTPSFSVNSSSFTISAGAVSSLTSTLTLSPSSAPGTYVVANGNDSYTVNFFLADQYQNPIALVKPQVASTNTNDTINQPTANTDASGTTTGSISSTIAGNRTLSISSPSGLTSSTVAATFIAGPASKLGFVQQPLTSPAGIATMNAIQVAVLDVQGNVVTTSNATVSLSIANNVNGAILSGTTSVASVNGVATFNGLGINKTGTYKLIANVSQLSVAYSNNFQSVAGAPAKLALSGPASVVSGTCYGTQAFTLQLQDTGGNPSNAPASMVIQLTGNGNGVYLSSCASSTPITTITFSTGSNTKTFYFKDQKSENLTLSAVDPSNVLATGTLALTVTPSQVSLTGPNIVASGKCSTAYTISTLGADNSPGTVKTDTFFQIAGQPKSATFWSDATCTTNQITDLTTFKVAANQGSSIFYIKDNVAEQILLNVSDPNGVINQSAAYIVNTTITASRLAFTGPTTVVAGTPSTNFTVKLMDAAGNEVSAPQDVQLNINGLTGTNAIFYSDSLASAPLTGSVTIPSGNSTRMIYLKDPTAENVTVTISDPTGVIQTSDPIVVHVSPSAFIISGPTPASSNTNICAGPFVVKTADGAGGVAPAVTPITASLTGNGTTGKFYSDAACTISITQLTFNEGQSAKNFYFSAYYPESLTFFVTDTSVPSVLSATTMNWTSIAAPAWIGTGQGTGGGTTATFDAGSPFIWQYGKPPVYRLTDSPQNYNALKFDSTKRYLYVVDAGKHRVFKYDYANNQYIGWLGRVSNNGQVATTGANVYALTLSGGVSSTVADDMNTNCVAKPDGQITGSWCQGGDSTWGDWSQVTTGSLNSPNAIAEDGNYIYVHSSGHGSIHRYNAKTGEFLGWIGRVYSSYKPSRSANDINGSSLNNTCSITPDNNPTPGWCHGGGARGDYTYHGNAVTGTNSLAYAVDSTGVGYLYAGGNGMVGRFNAETGAFSGWIGYIQNKTSGGTLTSAPGLTVANTCDSTPLNSITPGWCIGGYTQGNDWFMGSSIFADATNNALYVYQNWSNGRIWQFQLDTGAYVKQIVTGGVPISFTNVNNTSYYNTASITFDGNSFYVADSNRIAKISKTSGALQGWIGKVGTNNSLQNANGNPTGTCSTLAVNSNTTGWCLGGTSKLGFDESSFYNLQSIELDANGSIVAGQSFPGLKKFNKTTGNYEGTLGNAGSPVNWTDSQEIAGYQGYDDSSFFSPAGLFNDGTNLYSTELNAGRLKKINIKTGATEGWVGGIGGFLTGVSRTLGCGTNAIGVSTGWCLGALFSPLDLFKQAAGYGWLTANTSNGYMNNPIAVTGDTQYLYVADQSYHRILRFRKSDGVYLGWLGKISSATTGPAIPGADSASCTGANNQFTPGWCMGGMSTYGSTSNGEMYSPSAITYANGNLYVVDYSNSKVNCYNANSGAFCGWIGRVGSTTGLVSIPYAGTNSIVKSGFTYTNGWSTGGTSSTSSPGSDPGGGFSFAFSRGGIATDGTNLYISNTVNTRIDVFTVATGEYVKSAYAYPHNHSSVWVTNPNFGWGSHGPISLSHADGFLYYTYNIGSSIYVAAKMNKTTGQVVGWRGGINTSPIGGPGNCAGSTGFTPDWCLGGSGKTGRTLGSLSSGGFTTAHGITADANFVYISDEGTHRITRVPK